MTFDVSQASSAETQLHRQFPEGNFDTAESGARGGVIRTGAGPLGAV